MRADVHSEVRQIHPRALADLGEEACIIALGVARDLRSGEIPPDKYDQNYFHRRQTESACCIAGWMAIRGVDYARLSICSLGTDLFLSSIRKRFPIEAADAIERYIYDGSETPWHP